MTHIKVFSLVLLCVFIAQNVDGHPVDSDEDHLNIVITKGDTKVEIDLEDDLPDKRGATPEKPAESCNQIAEESCSESGYYWVKGSGDPVGIYCEMQPLFNWKGGWARVSHTNMTTADSECPNGLQLITNPRRMCRRPVTTAGCSSAIFSTYGISYTKVCGRVIAYQYDSPDAFSPYLANRALTIDDNYVDGVSITYGHNPRKHIWTLAAALDEVNTDLGSNCPCTDSTVTYDWAIPPFVGEDYYCETAHRVPFTDERYVYLLDDPLWDGKGCGTKNTCCDRSGGKPWFCKELSEATSEDIEIRMCIDQVQSDEEFPLEIVELFIQ